MFLCVVTK
ncbi:hypothetical protein ECNE1487_1722, partial [Escherichia coli NE1487]